MNLLFLAALALSAEFTVSPYKFDVSITTSDPYNTTRYANITITAPINVGWISLGIGSSMSNADMYICWLNQNNKATVGDFVSKGNVKPKMDTTQNIQGLQVVTDDEFVVFSFNRNVETGDAGDDTDLVNGENTFIWAVGKDRPKGASPDSDFSIHKKKGSFSLMLQFNDEGNATKAVTTIPYSNSSSNVGIQLLLYLLVVFAF